MFYCANKNDQLRNSLLQKRDLFITGGDDLKVVDPNFLTIGVFPNHLFVPIHFNQLGRHRVVAAGRIAGDDNVSVG